MNKRNTVSAVIVTFNKLRLLKECLNAVRKQTYPVDNIIIVNNASTDGTQEFLLEQKDIIVENSLKNVGGAGGFEIGIKHYYSDTNDEMCWIMDDDTIPDANSLEELIKASKKINYEFGFLSSFVYWKDGTPAIMNTPAIHQNWSENIEKGLIRIKSASFVSLLTQRKWVREVGLPIGEFFIWGDDVEYTTRLSAKEKSYLVPLSKTLHKMAQNTGVNILNDDYKRVPRYVYSFRNRFFTAKKKGIGKAAYEMARNCYLIGKILILPNDHRFLRIKQIIKGQLEGITFNPSIKDVK